MEIVPLYFLRLVSALVNGQEDGYGNTRHPSGDGDGYGDVYGCEDGDGNNEFCGYGCDDGNGCGAGGNYGYGCGSGHGKGFLIDGNGEACP